MKLRKSEIEVPKNFPVLRWGMRDIHGEVLDFLRGDLEEPAKYGRQIDDSELSMSQD